MHKIIRNSLGCAALSFMFVLTGCGNVVVHDLIGDEIVSITPDNVTDDVDENYVATDNTIEKDKIFFFEDCMNQDGNAVTSTELFGSRDVTMVNVWATFCGPCIREMPELGELAVEFDRENIGIVGVCCDVMDYEGGIDDGQLNLARDIIAETGVNYPNIMLNDMDCLDKVVNTDAVPTTFFVDSDGAVIGSVQVGAVDMDVYKSLAHEALDIAHSKNE